MFHASNANGSWCMTQPMWIAVSVTYATNSARKILGHAGIAGAAITWRSSAPQVVECSRDAPLAGCVRRGVRRRRNQRPRPRDFDELSGHDVPRLEPVAARSADGIHDLDRHRVADARSEPRRGQRSGGLLEPRLL